MAIKQMGLPQKRINDAVDAFLITVDMYAGGATAKLHRKRVFSNLACLNFR